MIDILMATYNGEKYLEEQLESIVNQSYDDWKLIIGDDCSTDRTVAILTKYQQMYPNKIFFHVNVTPSGSAQNNFFQLIDYVNNDYVMFADQDDIWLKDKIKLTFNMMRKAEFENGNRTPLLVHTDLCVVDQDLSVINNSIFAMQNMDYKRDKLNNLLVSNIVTGCTVMINKALLDLLNVKPQKSVMHDMWLGLVAAAFGKIYFINKATILYRQHGRNTNGVKNFNSVKFLFTNAFNHKCIHENLLKQYNQANEFMKIFISKLSDNQVKMLEDFSCLSNKNLVSKLIIINRYNLYKKGFIRIISQLLW